MKIRILYEEDIKNGVPHYTIVEIPDGDYVTVLEQDYQMRLADAPEGKKDKVKRCGTQHRNGLTAGKDMHAR